MGWHNSHLLPDFDQWKSGMLEWKNTINPLASGVKCAWKVTTVSWSYLEELRWNSNGLEALFEYERGKCMGILNGIDADVWDPAADSFLENQYTEETVDEGKEKNKLELCKRFGLDSTKPLIVFIGRLVGEKAADVLPDAILSCMYAYSHNISFLILGSGEPHIEWQLRQLNRYFPGAYNSMIGYNEALSHLMYAGADFLLMPSRVEPCGLNQMYSMKYGTVPMVRSTGGLRDTVIDMGEPGGWGIRFNHANLEDIIHSVGRAFEVYQRKEQLSAMRKHMMQIDNSWENAVQQYILLYQSLK